jgi:cell division protease FtsH
MESGMNRGVKTVVFWAVIVVSAFLLWQVVKSGANEPRTPEISYSQFVSQIASGQISKVTIAGSVVRGYDTKGASFRVIAPPNQSTMLESLQEHGVEIWFKEAPEQGWPNWIMNLMPLVLLAALWFFMIRQMKTASRVRTAAQGVSNSTSSPESQPRFGP